MSTERIDCLSRLSFHADLTEDMLIRAHEKIGFVLHEYGLKEFNIPIPIPTAN